MTIDVRDESLWLSTSKANNFLGLPKGTSGEWLHRAAGLEPMLVFGNTNLYSVGDLQKAKLRLARHFLELAAT